MDGEVVGYFRTFFSASVPRPYCISRCSIGKPLDPTHRDFVLGLMEEFVEEVRELLGRRHIPAEPFACARARTLIAIL